MAKFEVQFNVEYPVRSGLVINAESFEKACRIAQQIAPSQQVIVIYKLAEPPKLLIERAMSALDDYLNAGGKEARRQAAEKAKAIYKEYHGVDYVNRIDRKP